ncbi:hypothetical protein [Shimazuella alba]|jgi:tryptophan-rich sensory protein|uniref:Uncharacterized protein n=1 Tax=Shimazuella alba TaxID=2690964 RepID=A0A6I4VPK0_9BACL|nr:hypothetical protein [Shimazuella alba]MXQ53557.1 hypothetical protein [Shimazuella alba]
MEQAHLRSLRKKQLLYTNIIFLLYGILAYGVIFSRATGLVVYLVLAAIFLISPIGFFMFRSPQPLYLLFPRMKELQTYEKNKLKDAWFSYHITFAILQVAATIFFIIQAFIRNPKLAFIDGIPYWIIFAVSAILLWIGNGNQLFHARRLDNKTYEQLKVYAADRRTFAMVFAIVALVMTVIAIFVVSIMSRKFI